MQHDEVLFVAVQTYQVLEAVDAFQLLIIRPSSTSISTCSKPTGVVALNEHQLEGTHTTNIACKVNVIMPDCLQAAARQKP